MDLAASLPPIHADVTQKRLAFIAALVLRVWAGVRRSHKPKHGDTMWGFGTRFHERMCHALRQEATRQSWLRLIERRLHFVFTVGAVPFRFYRGYAARPRKNYLLRKKSEQDQHSLAGVDLDWCCRIAIEGGKDDEAPRVILVQHSASTGAVRNAWRITSEGEAMPEPQAATQAATQATLDLARRATPENDATPAPVAQTPKVDATQTPPPTPTPLAPPAPPISLVREAAVQKRPTIAIRNFDIERAADNDEES